MCPPTDVGWPEMSELSSSRPHRSERTAKQRPGPLGMPSSLAGPAQKLAGCDQLASPLGEQRPVPVTRVEIRHGTKRAAAQPSKTPACGLQARRFGMKIVVIGGTGLIGSKAVVILRERGHEVVAASPDTGVNSITGEGLKEAMAGTHVVIDLTNSPSFEDRAVLEFFETSGRNLLAAEAVAGVRHHVALSIVGDDRTPDNGYFRAKVAQEKLIETSGIPYTIIRSTQFLEFLRAIADSSADGNMVRLSPGLFQPIAADDVAAIVADVALG